MGDDFFPSSVPEGRTPVYFFTRNYYPILTGATERFRRYLPGLSERGVDFYVVTTLNDASLPEVEDTGVERILRVPLKGSGYVDIEQLIMPMFDELERAAPGTIQVFGFNSRMRQQLKRLRRFGHQILLVRTMMPSFQPPRLSLRGIRKSLRTRLDAASVDRITAGSTVMRDAFSLGSERLRQQYAIIPHGIDVERFRPPADEIEKHHLRKELGLRDGAFILLSVGSVMERKRTHLAVEAFLQLGREAPDVQLVVIGENQVRDTLAADQHRDSFSRYCLRVNETAGRCPPGSVVFAGEVENIEDYYRAADLFVFTSSIEGMPNAMIEAMASGLPCVTTPFRGLPETEFGKSGQEFLLSGDGATEIAAEVLGLMNDGARRAAIGQAARRFASSNLDSGSAIDAYARVYHREV